MAINITIIFTKTVNVQKTIRDNLRQPRKSLVDCVLPVKYCQKSQNVRIYRVTLYTYIIYTIYTSELRLGSVPKNTVFCVSVSGSQKNSAYPYAGIRKGYANFFFRNEIQIIRYFIYNPYTGYAEFCVSVSRVSVFFGTLFGTV